MCPVNILKFLNRRGACLGRRFSSVTDQPDNPVQKTWSIFRDDFRDLKDILLNKPLKRSTRHFPTHCDVLIVGGGVMGSSIAFWLKRRVLDGLKVVVLEKDPSVILNPPNNPKYRDCSTTLSVGGIRQQFSLRENIQLSLFSAEFLRNLGDYLHVEGEDFPDVGFNPAGYLFLATDQSAHILHENAILQTSLGAKVELLSGDKLKEKFGWINAEGIALASHGLRNEGWFDPWSLLQLLKKKAISLGAEFLPAQLLRFGFKKSNPSAQEKYEKALDHAIVKFDGEERRIDFGLVVIAAGAESGEVGALAGIGKGEGLLRAPLPVQPRKRYVYNIHCPDGPGLQLPFIIDPTGTYIRREGLGGHYVCGRSPSEENEPPTSDLDVDYDFFESQVWPVLAHRVPSFQNSKVKSGWAGFYDFNYFDENALIGFHPSFHNLYMATGFSGHGIQQSPGVGRAMMELIVDGEFQTLDLSRFSYQRYLDNQPLWESNIV